MAFVDEHLAETYKSLMLYGSAALKFVLTANGAAAIAVMTFLGHFDSPTDIPLPKLQAPLGLFVGGVFVGGIATVTAYLTQLSLYGESLSTSTPNSWHQKHAIWLRVSMSLILIGIILFGVGSLWAVSRLQ
jgi:hypothetical protein